MELSKKNVAACLDELNDAAVTLHCANELLRTVYEGDNDSPGHMDDCLFGIYTLIHNVTEMLFDIITEYEDMKK